MVSGSTNHNIKVDGHTDPRFEMVFNKVMNVPPIAGSLIFAWKAMIETNIE